MDQILFWNDVALEANRVAHTTGTSGSALPFYLPGLAPAPAGASMNAAIAAAAHTCLVKLNPSQQSLFDAKHAQSSTSEAGVEEGHKYGHAIAIQMLADRSADPDAFKNDEYIPGCNKTDHRPDPDNSPQGYHGALYGARSKCFSVTTRHDLDKPGNATIQNAAAQVRVKGIAPELTGTLPAGSNVRTPEETLIGIFWGYDGAKGLGTPPRLYNLIVRQIAIKRANTIEQNAQLFAMVNIAMADAGILAWDEKYRHNYYRPVVGIREFDKSVGFVTEPGNNLNPICDPFWLPLGAPKTNEPDLKNFTPNFPAYPSGHATFGAAALHITRLFYGVPAGDRSADNLFDGLYVVSEEMNGVNTDNKGTIRPKHARRFPRGLWQMIEENGLSRVYLGVHWSFDAFELRANGTPDLSNLRIGGAGLGIRIAEDIYNSSMQKSSVAARM
jgi:hypothetical protein